MTDHVQTYECLGDGMCVDPRCPTHSPPEMRRLVGAPDDYDGAPYCSDCGARKRQHCKCPPRPRND